MRYKVVRQQNNAANNWECKNCGNVFRTRKELYKHRHEEHPEYFQSKCWCKGLTKENNVSLAKSSTTLKQHLKDGSVKPTQLGKPLTEEHKQAISNGMKIAHQEGRAHNIGESRWNNEHSYPEKWLIKVLDNEFGMKENVDYRTEMPFGRYALDFAWENKKFAIEIDGEQHERFEEYKKRDEKKDELLKENSWIVMRIKWKDCFARPKEFIEIIRNKLKELDLF